MFGQLTSPTNLLPRKPPNTCLQRTRPLWRILLNLKGQSHMTSTVQTEATKGRCLCGDIRYEYRGAPIETLHCHCESCRRHASSPFSTFVVVNKDTFRYT